MPRPKGSKNKASSRKEKIAEKSIDLIAKEIAETEETIAYLNDKLKEQKTKLKRLQKEKAIAEKAEEKVKKENEKKKLLEALENSTRSAEEIIEFLK